ncbi:hypothetical protein CAEBREN_23107 [Caenorhabditis brenneri]|uniref:Uncharacterized protein n=1 Tax=Caenorhabditis brenneri TaxID=135651 RepID=G0NKD3_CAEBE|nr:hypothetical protein CAEBREN_23107 [Caenorhabditis brenneri]
MLRAQIASNRTSKLGLENIVTPAEIEEYFDYLAANERQLKILLALQ